MRGVARRRLHKRRPLRRELVQEHFISLRQANEAFLIFETLRRLTHGEIGDHATGYDDETREDQEVEERVVHGRSMAESAGRAYPLAYAIGCGNPRKPICNQSLNN